MIAFYCMYMKLEKLKILCQSKDYSAKISLTHTVTLKSSHIRNWSYRRYDIASSGPSVDPKFSQD